MFPENIQFRHPWRVYQQRVLDDIETHLADSRLHIIAPPGSGKTVLGLEVVRRLNRPTLILSPTLTIRDQWIDRFRTLFSGEDFTDISFRLKDPAGLTSSTYQSLHACYSRKPEEEGEREETDFDLAEVLKDRGIEVIVLDEAHHLKTEWWKSLIALLGRLDNPVVIALTATPPYDSTQGEWNRYMELCGPVDAEIAVPELVREGDLCAHQDLVYLSSPTGEEYGRINRFYDGADSLRKQILEDGEFRRLLETHPALAAPETREEEIYGNIEYYSSLIIFLHHLGGDSQAALLRYMGMEKRRIPGLDEGWMECLLTNAFFRDGDLKDHPLIRGYLGEFKKSGLIERGNVVLSRKEEIDRLIASSASKFGSIRKIVDHEQDVLKDNLRLVLLTDYVRRESLRESGDTPKFGVVPIFRYLLGSNSLSRFDYSRSIAVLCGSLVIIPGEAKEDYALLAEGYAPVDRGSLFREVGGTENFYEVTLSEKIPSVKIMTELFSRGIIRVLIGTKSLLGEGWDCQEVNSLVLATFVGSYMLSNQMRGRAIRAQKDNPSKTSHIWHLMCLDPRNRSNRGDYSLLASRFRGFIGPHVSQDILLSGLDRLEIPRTIASREEMEEFNAKMVTLAGEREGLIGKWERSLCRDGGASLVREIRTGRKNLKREFLFRKTLKYALADLCAWGAYSTVNLFRVILRGARSAHLSGEKLLSLLSLALLAGLVSLLPGSLRILMLALRHGPVSSSFKQLALVILRTLKELDMIDHPREVSLETGKTAGGSLSCSLKNSTPYDQSLFLQCLEELLGQIINPRYLVTRKGRFIKGTLDYHGVPSLFAVKKERAEVFLKHWNRLMGKSELIYTRTREGRKLLIRARTNSLSSNFVEDTEIVDSWKH